MENFLFIEVLVAPVLVELSRGTSWSDRHPAMSEFDAFATRLLRNTKR